MSQMSQWVMSHDQWWLNESMSQVWKNKSFGRNNKIKHYFYLFCLLASPLPAQGLFLTWNLDLDLGCLLAVSHVALLVKNHHPCANTFWRHHILRDPAKALLPLLEKLSSRLHSLPRYWLLLMEFPLNRTNTTAKIIQFWLVNLSENLVSPPYSSSFINLHFSTGK